MFYLERSRLAGQTSQDWLLTLVGESVPENDEITWDVLAASSAPLGVDSVPGFAGLPGLRARIRFKESVVAVFVWDKIPTNRADPEPDTAWGWKCIETHPWPKEAATNNGWVREYSVD